MNSEPASPSHTPQRRSIFRLSNGRRQLQYSLLLPSIGLFSTVLFCASGWIMSDHILLSMHEEYGVDFVALESAGRALHLLFSLVIASSVVVGIANVILGIAWSHRIFGPLVPLREHVRKLRAGQYDSRVRLRTYDEFKELAQELNDLAESLGQPTGKTESGIE